MIWGVDFGSRSVKMVLFENGRIKETQIHDTISFYRQCRLDEEKKLRVLDEKLASLFITPVVTTGYGRNLLALDNSRQIPETMAHVIGAQYLTGLSDFLLIDIGGQDSKVILVENGKIADFAMNDKCAASSGRYLENMAKVLGVSLEELGKEVTDPIELDSTCAIFGESELINKLVEGVPIASLCAGVNFSIYRRIAPMLTRFKSEHVLLSGGVSKNHALCKIIQDNLSGKQVMELPKAQFAGAVGCAQWYYQQKND